MCRIMLLLYLVILMGVPTKSNANTNAKIAKYSTTGYLDVAGNSWNNSRNLTESNSTETVPEMFIIVTADPLYDITRNLFRFDTSIIGTATIDSVKLNIAASFVSVADDFTIRICDTTDSLDTGHINATMWNEIKGWASSGAYTPTYLSDTAPVASTITVGDTLRFTMNSAGLTNINKTGITQFWMLNSDDIASNDPGTTKYSRVQFSDTAYLQAWYTLPSSGQSRVVLFNNGTTTAIMRNGTATPVK